MADISANELFNIVVGFGGLLFVFWFWLGGLRFTVNNQEALK